MPRINLSVQDTARLVTIVEQHGSIDALEAALRRRVSRTPPMTAREILDAYSTKLLTRVEARKMLGIRTTTTRSKQ